MWQSAGNLMPQLYTLAISVAAARFLGPERLGRQSFIAFVALSVVMLVSFGISQSLQRSIAAALGRRRADEAHGLANWGARVLLGLAAVGGSAIALPGLLGADPKPAWLLAGLATALAIAHAAPSTALLAAQRFRDAARVGLATGLLAVVGTIAVLAAGGGIAAIFAVEAAVSAVNLVWTTALARRSWQRLGLRPAPSPKLQRAAARYGGFLTLSIMLSFIAWRRSEFFFLTYYSSDTQIALYSIAFAATAALSALPERLSLMMISAFATLLGAGAHDRVKSSFSRALRLILLLTLLLTAAALATGPEAIATVYGQRYRDAGELLLILLLIVPFVPLWHLSNSLLTALGKVRAPLLMSGAAAIVNLALAFLLIPPLDAVGAALANLGAQLCGTAMAFAYARRELGPIEWRLPWLLRGLVVV
jgi:O-antigen/teichoic acid export membrane protein